MYSQNVVPSLHYAMWQVQEQNAVLLGVIEGNLS